MFFFCIRQSIAFLSCECLATRNSSLSNLHNTIHSLCVVAHTTLRPTLNNIIFLLYFLFFTRTQLNATSTRSEKHHNNGSEKKSKQIRERERENVKEKKEFLYIKPTNSREIYFFFFCLSFLLASFSLLFFSASRCCFFFIRTLTARDRDREKANKKKVFMLLES